MPKIIFTSRYIKSSAAAGRLLKYVATRDGVERMYTVNSTRPATENQRKLIDEIVRTVPEAAASFEYEDYTAAPSIKNAGAFISSAFEQEPQLWGKVQNYVEYIAKRPGAQRSTSSGHGLWNGNSVNLAGAVNEIASHKGNVWTHVISLRREDAERMGYNNADSWRSLVQEQLPVIANAMKIPVSNLRWYAAYHDKDTNPHIHMLIYSQNPSQGFLTEAGIEKMRSSFARSIYKDEFMHIYQRKDLARSDINRFADERLKELAEQVKIDNGELVISERLRELGEQLQHSKGKKQYGYLPPALKRQVDEIVALLAGNPQIVEMYRHWCELNADVKRMYTSKLDSPPPLQHEKSFTTIKNMVIRQALVAAEQEIFEEAVPERDKETFSEAQPTSTQNMKPANNPSGTYYDSSNSCPVNEQTDIPNTKNAHGNSVDPDEDNNTSASPPSAEHSNLNTRRVKQYFPGVESLLRHLAGMIRDDYVHQRQRYERAVDRKLMTKIRKKKQEHGQRID